MAGTGFGLGFSVLVDPAASQSLGLGGAVRLGWGGEHGLLDRPGRGAGRRLHDPAAALEHVPPAAPPAGRRVPGARGLRRRPRLPLDGERTGVRSWADRIQQPGRVVEGAGADAVRPRPHRPHQPGARPGPTGATARRGRTGRPTYVPPAALERRVSATPYAELHCHSTFSFLDGASHPEELAEEAVRLGLEALAITDHDGFYGVVRFAEAARAVGMPTVFGAELSLGLTKPQNGVPDPEGSHLLVLARDPEGYARLASTISAAQLPRRREGQADLRRHRLGGGPRRPLAGAHRLPQGHRPPGPRAPRPGRRRAGARRADRHLRAPQRGGGAVRPRRPARLAPQRRPRPARHAGRRRRRRHHQRPLRHAGPPSAGHRDGGGAGPAQPRRARPVAARQRRRPPALGRRAGAPLRPLARRGGAGRRARAGLRLRPAAGRAAAARRSRAPTASARWRYLRRLTAEGRRSGAYGDVGRRSGCRAPTARSSTSWR